MIKLVKSALILLLLGCLFNLPYGYYEFVRFAAFIGFGILAYEANNHNKKTEVLVFIVLAVLFQPFIKIALGREVWNIVDVLVSIGLIISLFKKEG